jgi:DNA primase
VATLPAPHDPDSFIKQFGGSAFQQRIDDRFDFFEFYLNHLCVIHDVKTDKGKILVTKEMGEVLRRANSDVLIDLNAQRTSNRLGISLETVRGEFKKVSGTKMDWTREDGQENPVEGEKTNLSVQELWLLKLLLLHDDLVAWTALHLDENWISHESVRQIVRHRLAAQKNETWKNLAAFLDECDSPEMKSLITEAVAEDRKIPNPEQQLADVVLKLRNQFLDRQIAALTQNAARPQISDLQKVEILQEQQKLRAQKRAPLSPLQN